MEQFEHRSPEGLEQLRSQCKRHSTAKLQLIPGYSITNTLGNKMMFIGPGVRKCSAPFCVFFRSLKSSGLHSTEFWAAVD